MSLRAKAVWVTVALFVLGVVVALLARWHRSTGRNREAWVLEVEHTAKVAQLKLKLVDDKIAQLEARGSEASAALIAALKEAEDVEAEATQAFQAKGMSAEAIALRFARIRRQRSPQ